MRTVELNFWYKDIPLVAIAGNWFIILDALGLEKLPGFKEAFSEGYYGWNFLRFKGEEVFGAITERIDNHVAVSICSHTASNSDFETILKKVYEFKEFPLPVESFLINDYEECAGPLLTFRAVRKNPKGWLEGIKSNLGSGKYIHEIRVVSSSIYPNLEELLELSKEYSTNQKIINNNLWIDFGWSKDSKTWSM